MSSLAAIHHESSPSMLARPTKNCLDQLTPATQRAFSSEKRRDTGRALAQRLGKGKLLNHREGRGKGKGQCSSSRLCFVHQSTSIQSSLGHQTSEYVAHQEAAARAFPPAKTSATPDSYYPNTSPPEYSIIIISHFSPTSIIIVRTYA